MTTRVIFSAHALRLIVCVLCAVTTSARTPLTSTASQEARPPLVLAPFVGRAITPAVHLLSTPPDYFGVAIGNVTLIEQADGFVVIDSGMTAAHGRIVVAYARSLAPKPIKVVAITHWHNDHPQGVSAIRDAYPDVRIISTKATERALLSAAAAFDVGYAPNSAADAAVAARLGETLQQYRELLSDPATAADRRERITRAIAQITAYIDAFPGTYIVPPTETFDRELVIADDQHPVRLRYLGHANTDGDLVAWLPKQRIVVTGDIVVSPYPFGFGSFPQEWIRTLGTIKTLGFKTLIPGHGEPQHDVRYLDTLITAISAIRTQVAALAKQGLSLEDVKAKADFTATAELFGNTPRDKANFQALFGSPMTENAYKEARGLPMGYVASEQPRFTEKAPPSKAIHHKR